MTWLRFVGEGENFAQLQQALLEIGYAPEVTFQGPNFYDQNYLDAAGEGAEGTFVEVAFWPFEEAADKPGHAAVPRSPSTNTVARSRCSAPRPSRAGCCSPPRPPSAIRPTISPVRVCWRRPGSVTEWTGGRVAHHDEPRPTTSARPAGSCSGSRTASSCATPRPTRTTPVPTTIWSRCPPAPPADQNRVMQMRRTLACLLAVGLTAAACGERDPIDPGATDGATATDDGATAAPDGDFGDLSGVCGPDEGGGATVGDPDEAQGVDDDSIKNRDGGRPRLRGHPGLEPGDLRRR